MNGYELSRKWFDWCFENPEKTKPIHTALYFFAVEHCNRLGWKHKFGLPTEMAKEAIGVKSWHTYIASFNDLVEWGFFVLIEKSKNQYSSNIIALSNFDEALDEAYDKALTKHVSKQLQSTYQSNDSINKLINLITINHKHINDNFEKFEKFVLSLNEEQSNSGKTEQEILEDVFNEYKDYFSGYSIKEHCGRLLNTTPETLEKLMAYFLLVNGKQMTVECKTKYAAEKYFINWAKKEANKQEVLNNYNRIFKPKPKQ